MQMVMVGAGDCLDSVLRSGDIWRAPQSVENYPLLRRMGSYAPGLYHCTDSVPGRNGEGFLPGICKSLCQEREGMLQDGAAEVCGGGPVCGEGGCGSLYHHIPDEYYGYARRRVFRKHAGKCGYVCHGSLSPYGNDERRHPVYGGSFFY